MHLVPAVSDVQGAHDFYRDVFGWESHLEWPGEYTELVITEDDRLRSGGCRPPGRGP